MFNFSKQSPKSLIKYFHEKYTNKKSIENAEEIKKKINQIDFELRDMDYYLNTKGFIKDLEQIIFYDASFRNPCIINYDETYIHDIVSEFIKIFDSLEEVNKNKVLRNLQECKRIRSKKNEMRKNISELKEELKRENQKINSGFYRRRIL